MYILFLQLLLSNFCTYVPFLKKKKKRIKKCFFVLKLKSLKFVLSKESLYLFKVKYLILCTGIYTCIGLPVHLAVVTTD